MKLPLPPNVIFEELFEDLHASRIWPDGKMISDAIPLTTPEKIVHLYREEKNHKEFNLKAFFELYFRPNPSKSIAFESDLNRPIKKHIELLWKVLTREKDEVVEGSSLLPLPHPYIVPGGRFNEIYYWDSYFTMLGLQKSGEVEMIEHMVNNFSHLIDTVGFIPNGNRSYFLGRSQPPFYSLMVALLAEEKGDEVFTTYHKFLEKEYTFWMQGTEQLSKKGDAFEHVVQGTDLVLNRYFDQYQEARAEMYQTDLDDAKHSTQPEQQLFGHLRASCESGWDFSSRWFKDPNDLHSIYTSDIVPVDLNCLLYHLETVLAKAYRLSGNIAQEQHYQLLAEKRKTAIQSLFWEDKNQFFHDLHRVSQTPTPAVTLAGIFPLFFGVASKEQAAACAKRIEQEFLRDGGVVTTGNNTGQQWDAPNGWAPLQWTTIKGLHQYGYHSLTKTIAQRWIDLNTQVYHRTGRLLEKYNVEDTTLLSEGGEYAVQDGFGWTNGVLLKLLSEIESY